MASDTSDKPATSAADQLSQDEAAASAALAKLAAEAAAAQAAPAPATDAEKADAERQAAEAAAAISFEIRADSTGQSFKVYSDGRAEAMPAESKVRP